MIILLYQCILQIQIKVVTILIRQKIHLIKNFKVNILIDINVITSKNIIINLIKKRLFKIIIFFFF